MVLAGRGGSEYASYLKRASTCAQRGNNMLELSRIITSLGAVAASTGLIVYGIGASFWEPSSFELTTGMWLMIGGVIATIVGGLMYRRSIADE